MPYIKQDERVKIDVCVDALAEALRATGDDGIEGSTNYAITTLLCKAMRPQGGWKYKWLNRVVGTLECIKLEFYRRGASVYEDGCIERNGDVKDYEDFLANFLAK